jgi:hypothetical protein
VNNSNIYKKDKTPSDKIQITAIILIDATQAHNNKLLINATGCTNQSIN